MSVSPEPAAPPYAERFARVRRALDEADVDGAVLSVGPDLPWLTGYESMPLERLTMLVVPADGDATLVVPELEAGRVVPRPELFSLWAFAESEDPVAVVDGLLGGASRVAVGDRTWARFLVDLQIATPARRWRRAGPVLGPLRAVKDAAEVAALREAAAAADRVAGQLRGGDVPLLGRTEAEVSADLGHRLVAEGHRHVNFAIVAAGADAASPHHEPGSRRIGPGEIVLCDFGGTRYPGEPGEVPGYCSDITRCVITGEPSARQAELYEVVRVAHAAGLAAAATGTPASEVDGAARRVIADAGYGDAFLHRLGHGIGIEAHEDPYLVAGNDEPLAEGQVFSVEPGIYLAEELGIRLEDIVVTGPDGAETLNQVGRELAVVEA